MKLLVAALALVKQAVQKTNKPVSSGELTEQSDLM